MPQQDLIGGLDLGACGGFFPTITPLFVCWIVMARIRLDARCAPTQTLSSHQTLTRENLGEVLVLH